VEAIRGETPIASNAGPMPLSKTPNQQDIMKGKPGPCT